MYQKTNLRKKKKQSPLSNDDRFACEVRLVARI